MGHIDKYNRKKLERRGDSKRLISLLYREMHFRFGLTRCKCCQKEMYFPFFETKEEFLNRIEDRGWWGETIFLDLRLVTIDHIIELSNGGPDSVSNWQLLCNFCNQVKNGSQAVHDISIEQWRDD